LPYGTFGVLRPVDAGTLDGEARLTGRIDAPVLHVSMNAKDIVRGTVSGIAFDATVDSVRRNTDVAAHVAVQGSPLVNAKAKLGFDFGMILAGTKVNGSTLEGNVDVPGFDLSKVAALIPGLAGNLHGGVVAKGRLNAPTLAGDLDIDGFAIGQIKMDAFALHGSYGADGGKVELKAHEPSGGFLDGAVAFGPRGIDASLRARAFAIDFRSEGESIPIRMLHGVLDAHVTAKGPTAGANIAGHLGFTKGALGLTADPREISDVNLQLALDSSELKLEKLTGRLGPGKFDVTGNAKLDHLVPASLDLVLHTKQLPALENPISVAVDSKITVHGERKNGALSGTIRIDSGSARLPTLTNVRNLQSTSALKDVVYIDERGRAAVLKRRREANRPLSLTIETKLPGPFHVRSKELDVDLRGDLAATVHGEDFRLRGVVESLIGGHLELFGKRYDIDQVRVSFDGGKTINPFIYVKLTRQLIAALITIEVQGTVEKPQLTLTASPPIYSDSQIIQAILGGDPGEGTTDRGLDQKVTGAISGLVVGAIKDQLAPQLPIDVIKIDVGDSSTAGYTGIAQTRLEIGKYLTNSIYVSYVHQFGALQIGTQVLSANLGTFEYRFKRHYALDLTIGDAPEGRADLFWSIRF
jgi:translocation and assembly module TamB